MSSSWQAVLAQRLENNSYPQISTIKCQWRGSLALCLFQDKRCQHQGEIDPFKQPTAKQRLSFTTPWIHLHPLPSSKVYVPMIMSPSTILFPRGVGQGPPSCPLGPGGPCLAASDFLRPLSSFVWVSKAQAPSASKSLSHSSLSNLSGWLVQGVFLKH